MLITDYSSVAFDFGYLNKPVIYAQFDRDEVYSGEHIFTKNYVSAEKDGFGPVVNNYAKTIETAIKLIKNDFVLPKKYRGRSERFYFYHDRKNCERLLKMILRTSGESR
jgi:CDP-glycerol glycerophosphotransferase (TagB/SpsB family)